MELGDVEADAELLLVLKRAFQFVDAGVIERNVDDGVEIGEGQKSFFRDNNGAAEPFASPGIASARCAKFLESD